MTATLRITDGTKVIDLLDIDGWLLRNWRPAVPEPKGGGTFRSSPLSDGRKLVARPIGNVFDTFTLVGSESSQDMMITSIQELQRLLEKATQYWTSDWQREPVWIEARSQYETNPRYATILDYRATDFSNPYAHPFFACTPASELMLTIEHLPWTDNIPGDEATCVQISSQGVTNTSAGVSYETDAQWEDCNAYQPGTMASGTNLSIGRSDVIRDTGFWFENVAVANGAQIIYAKLTLTASSSISNDAFETFLFYENPSATSGDDFNQTYIEFKTRDWVYDKAYPIGDTTLDTAYIFDVTSAIQAIVDSAHWASGDDLALAFMTSMSSTPIAAMNYRLYYAGMDAAGDPPTLNIYYASTSVETGADPTCENEVYVGNKQTMAVINRCYYLNESVPRYSDNLVGEATPFELLPHIGDIDGEAPAVGDRLMFCSKISEPNSGPFSNVILDIGTAASGITGEWYYWNGAETILGTSGTDICGNLLFEKTGLTQVVFDPPEDWTTLTRGGVEGYWIWFEVTAVDTPVPPTQGDGIIYTVTNAYVDIDEAQVGGDIPALSRILYDLTNCSDHPTSKIIIGLRSMERGSSFSAYLNASDEQNPVGITYNILDGSLADASEAPSGRNHIITDANATLTNIANWDLNAVANSYFGSYHAFLRVRQVTGNAGDVSMRVFSYTGGSISSYRYSDTGYTLAKSVVHAVDLGKFTIATPYRMRLDENVNMLSIGIQLSNPNGEDIEIYDLVLMPSDEWIGTFGSIEAGVSGYRYDFDGATHPRSVRSSLNWIIDDDNHNIYSEVVPTLSSIPILQANRDQRLWFTQMYDDENYVYIETIGKVRLQRANRYLLSRGSR